MEKIEHENEKNGRIQVGKGRLPPLFTAPLDSLHTPLHPTVCVCITKGDYTGAEILRELINAIFKAKIYISRD